MMIIQDYNEIVGQVVRDIIIKEPKVATLQEFCTFKYYLYTEETGIYIIN